MKEKEKEKEKKPVGKSLAGGLFEIVGEIVLTLLFGLLGAGVLWFFGMRGDALLEDGELLVLVGILAFTVPIFLVGLVVMGIKKLRRRGASLENECRTTASNEKKDGNQR